MRQWMRGLALGVISLVILSGCQGYWPKFHLPKPPPAPARTERVEGQMCGGIAGFACGSGLYCQITPGQCRTIADAAGTCQARSQICPMIYKPVCGCDGRTYSNGCVAAGAGVSVAADGACEANRSTP